MNRTGSRRLLACVLILAVLGPALAVRAAGQDSPLRIIQLSGDPAEIGTQHGEQLAEPIKLLHERYLMHWFEDKKLYKLALMAAFIFRNQLLPEHRAELVALAKTTGIDPGDAMLANCFLDLSPAMGCSTITLPAGASPDGIGRFGRNLDFPSLGVADKYSILFIVRPKDHYAFAAVSWPGLIGVLSGMNEHGLALTNMEVPRAQRMPEAMPYTLLYRTILERCRTVDEAIDLLNKTSRQSANNLMLMDAAGHRAVAEITPEKVTIRRAPDSAALISTNHQRGEDLDKPGLCWRFDKLHKEAAAQFGRIDAAAIERMLGQVAQGKETLQSMVFEPSTLTLYLATGVEATRHTYRKIELKPYFQKK